MGMLGKKFPKAQFVITGVLGPERYTLPVFFMLIVHSNAHGPNEMLHLDFAQRVTCCVASLLVDHCQQFKQ